ncbi:craniofacial development protein 2-like [Palaemon carinicauda]|uniref:craniofacial development protein 2-like n=1 Tax=Palaemon carinicauda TaxID=392227 RepID=UPI0035B69315
MLNGDFNAKLVKGVRTLASAVGSGNIHVILNDNGPKLISFTLDDNFAIGGSIILIGKSIFPHKEIHKPAWRSPGRTNNQIDHIHISRNRKGTLEAVRSFRGANCSTDHYLVCVKVRPNLKVDRSRPIEKRKRFVIDKLKEDNTRNNFQLKLANRLQILSVLQEERVGSE